MSLKKVQVTGVDGFIGSHLTESLVRAGYDTRAFVMYNSLNSWGWLNYPDEDVKGKFEIIAGDIRDPRGVDNAMEGCDAVLHLAALIAIPISCNSPDRYVVTNITGTLNIVQAARRLGTKRIICTSTSETYGTTQYAPITEEHPLSAQSPYAATKVAADQLALSFQKSFATPVTVLRPFNTYGPRQSARAVIPTIIGQIAAGHLTKKLEALNPTLDFTFVHDTAQGFIQAMECDSCIGEVANIGSDFEISIKNTVQLIAETMGVEIEIVLDDKRMRPPVNEVERLFASVDKARRLFGWSPKHSGIGGCSEGISKTTEWFQSPVKLAAYKIDHNNI